MRVRKQCAALLIIMVLCALMPPLLTISGVRTAKASPESGQRVDNTTVTIHYPVALPSAAESQLYGYNHFEFNVSGDVADIEDGFNWYVVKDPASCLDPDYSMFHVSGYGYYAATAKIDNLQIKLVWGINVYIAINTRTQGVLHYDFSWWAIWGDNGTVSRTWTFSGKFKIFNSTSQEFQTIYESGDYYVSKTGTLNITSDFIHNGWTYILIYYEAKAIVDTNKGGTVHIPEIGDREYILVYQMYIDRYPTNHTVFIDHTVYDEYIVHHLRVENPEYGTKIVVYKPSHWSFYLISPNATVTEYSDRIEITDTQPVTYDIYFTSTDFQNYPRQYTSRISYFNTKNEYIPFEAVFTYYNLSWSEVESPEYSPLYSSVFTMDRAQYLSIKVVDRWGSVLLEAKNLTYQEFYNFTLPMYTFKIVSFQEDFVYMKLKRAESADWYTEWIAPGEIEEEYLASGWYNLTLVFKNGTEYHEDFYLDTDMTYVITGWTLERLRGEIRRDLLRFLYISLRSAYLETEVPVSQFVVLINGSQTYNEMVFINGTYANVTVTDLAGHELYSEVVNVVETGWLTIDLNVTRLLIVNPYEQYALVVTITAADTNKSVVAKVPPRQMTALYLQAANYSFTAELYTPDMSAVLQKHTGTIELKPVGEDVFVYGWNFITDVYTIIKAVTEEGTVEPVFNIKILLNYSTTPIPFVYTEIYKDNKLVFQGYTDSQGQVVGKLYNVTLVGKGKLSFRFVKYGVSRWYNTTYSVRLYLGLEAPEKVVQGESATVHVVLHNPSKVADTPVTLENCTIRMRLLTEEGVLVTEEDRLKVDIPTETSSLDLEFNMTETAGDYYLEIAVVYAGEVIASRRMPISIVPPPEMKVYVPWWFILLAFGTAIGGVGIAWIATQLTRGMRRARLKIRI